MMEMLTPEQVILQQSGGTWADLFNRAAWVNSNAWVSLLVWYGAFLLLGIIAFPLTSLVFGRMKDRGWSVSRLFGLLVLGYVTWLGGFFGFTYTRAHIGIVLALFTAVNLLILCRRRSLWREWKESRRDILSAELAFTLCFGLFLLIRLGNPDLWHPYKGGERPMDFSYFNAILKSSVFPPYDPWFSGGYLNYYYYGMFLAGIPVKFLGVIPSVAFNLILATWYGFLGSAVYGLGSTLYARVHGERGSRVAGFVTVLFTQVLGNLGTVVQIKNELVELGVGIPADQVSGFFRQFSAFFNGLGRLLSGSRLMMYKGDWYWIPSRAIPDTSITEFPFFTFLYGDPHAHLFALPITVLVLAWLTCFVLRLREGNSGKFAGLRAFGMILPGALIIGTLIPTNTWDMPTYLCLSGAVLLYAFIRYGVEDSQKPIDCDGNRDGRLVKAVIAVALLAGLTLLFFLPYFRTNTRENQFELWRETFTPIRSYLMHWGTFLFFIASWYALETRDWMAKTPLRLWFDFKKRYGWLLTAVLICGLGLMISLGHYGVRIIWIALPLMAWSLCLLLRPLCSDESPLKRLIYFIVGVALFASVLVELIHLLGDYGRMNTVFKFYNQIWIMLSLSAAFAAVSCWTMTRTVDGGSRLRIWRGCACLLIFGCFLYPVFAGTDKVTDRMADDAPHTLDGMTYMAYSEYWQDGFLMDLSQDYEAIQWVQDHIKGSPVIVEANATEYKFGSRYSMYTGLPGVVGWNYHQRQQRGPISEQVWARVRGVERFYNTPDRDEAMDFIRQYGVRYIIVGQMERGMYDAEGIRKFRDNDAVLWNCVYSSQDTEIYEVIYDDNI